MFEGTVAFDVQMIKGTANILLGGEGLFLATLSGPGRIWPHSMTVSTLWRIGSAEYSAKNLTARPSSRPRSSPLDASSPRI